LFSRDGRPRLFCTTVSDIRVYDIVILLSTGRVSYQVQNSNKIIYLVGTSYSFRSRCFLYIVIISRYRGTLSYSKYYNYIIIVSLNLSPVKRENNVKLKIKQLFVFWCTLPCRVMAICNKLVKCVRAELVLTHTAYPPPTHDNIVFSQWSVILTCYNTIKIIIFFL